MDLHKISILYNQNISRICPISLKNPKKGKKRSKAVKLGAYFDWVLSIDGRHLEIQTKTKENEDNEWNNKKKSKGRKNVK